MAGAHPPSPALPYHGGRHVDPVAGAPGLEVRELCVGYPGAARTPSPGAGNGEGEGGLALAGVTLVVPVGGRVALVGHNGAGKSTLLKAVAGLLPIRSGTVRVYGQPIGACHHRVAYLPQRGEIDWRFPVDVRDLVTTGRYVHLGWLRRPGAVDRRLVDEALERLGIAELADRQIGRLSGGQQQRALIARALVQDADLLLLDEPLNAIDAETRAVVAELLAELRRRHKTVVTATHDLGRLEVDYDDALYLSEGRPVAPPSSAFAPTDELRSRGAEVAHPHHHDH